jgi:hypothetical protein
MLTFMINDEPTENDLEILEIIRTIVKRLKGDNLYLFSMMFLLFVTICVIPRVLNGVLLESEIFIIVLLLIGLTAIGFFVPAINNLVKRKR